VVVGCSDKLAYVAAVLTAVKSVAVPATDGKKRGKTEKQRKLNFFFSKKYLLSIQILYSPLCIFVQD
jgi:hypothetical protein